MNLAEFPCPMGGICRHVCDSTTGCYREKVWAEQNRDRRTAPDPQTKEG